jgi:hypothetical protein
MPDVVKELLVERELQSATWDKANDDRLALEQWVCLMTHYASRQLVGDFSKVNVADVRRDFIKVGALAIAAVEAIDRTS